MKIYNLFKKKGKHCFLYPLPDKRLALKIFNAYPLNNWENLSGFRWGDPPAGDNPDMSVPLIDATKIQNIAWMHGLAPRVYGIVKVRIGNQKYWAQEVELVEGEFAENKHEVFYATYKKVKDLGLVYGFESEKDDVSAKDVIGGKLVDFNTFHFTKDHLGKVKKAYIEKARYGKIYYHNVPEWGLVNSPRKNKDRVKYMKLDEIDFKGKSVLDLGCAGGYFCRYVKDRGAGYVRGVDFEDPVFAAFLVSNELMYWDIDFYNKDICNYQPTMKFDIVFFLSMNYHIGIPSWLAGVTKKICIFEDNSKERNAKKTLTKMFKEVKLVGKARDHGMKPIYHCRH